MVLNTIKIVISRMKEMKLASGMIVISSLYRLYGFTYDREIKFMVLFLFLRLLRERDHILRSSE